ncbi:AMP-binding protein [Spartinivicinus ruber]|uniref:AMP-binding protein n=1 Tax=Spartinivicinus ruber TaxID=2683272 RepID=UPI0013D39BB6|nr:AMP-binding protein [Spartinivicinus ruber]
MISLFYQQVLAHPERLALVIGGFKLTYYELWNQANTIACFLKQQGVKPGQVIGLHLSKSNNLVVNQLACWLVGAAFMPLPPDWPVKRKQQFLIYSQAVGIITDSIVIDLMNNGIKQWLVVNIDNGKNSVTNNSYREPLSSDIAYVIFTSGSSGEPKGVLVPFAGLPAVITQQIDFTQLKPGERCLWLHHPGFDASIADIWVTLLAGATLIADNNISPDKLLQFIADNNINYVDLPAVLLSTLDIQLAPNCLHTLLVGGEVCDFEALRNWGQLKRLVIAYGPSETTICSSMYLVSGKESAANWIGQPLKHLQYWVVDDQLQPVSPGQQGELLITGLGVAVGYLNGNRSIRRFVQFKGRKGYRTGDLVRQVEQNFQFLGRLDRQFKLYGQLICPEEIEQMLLRYAYVSEAYVFKYKQQLVAAVAPELDYKLLQAWLLKRFPQWMCPQQWLLLPKLPRSQNQKISQAELVSGYEQQQLKTPACPELTLIRQVLQQPAIQLEDNLQKWSLSSMQWLELLMGLKRLGLQISYQQLLKNVSIKAITEWYSIQRKNRPEGVTNNSNGISADLLNQMLLQYPVIKLTTKKKQYNAVLLTGATGLLGAELLSLLSLQERTIYCLVRGDKSRLYQHCQNQGVNINWSRVVILAGDICQPYLNLTKREWTTVAEQVSDIYLCAADTSLLKDYQQLQKTNVTGTYYVLQLMATGNINQGALPIKDWFNSRLLLKPDFSQLPANVCVDFTPVNYAAKLMLGISQQSESGTFHICNSNPVLASDLALLIGAQSNNRSQLIWQPENPTDPLRLFKMTNMKIVSDVTDHYAQVLKLAFPIVDNNYLQVYLESLWQQ